MAVFLLRDKVRSELSRHISQKRPVNEQQSFQMENWWRDFSNLLIVKEEEMEYLDIFHKSADYKLFSQTQAWTQIYEERRVY